MERDLLFQNKLNAVLSLHEQTGRDVRGLSGMYPLFVANVLTGNEVDYGSHANLASAAAEMQRVGFVPLQVEHRRPDPAGLVAELITSKKFGIDAIIVQGQWKVQGVESTVGIVPTVTYDKGKELRQYHVVDLASLDGVLTYHSVTGMRFDVEKFDPATVKVSVLPTPEELARRDQPDHAPTVSELFEVVPDSYIKVPVPIDDPRYLARIPPELQEREQEKDRQALLRVAGAFIDDIHSEVPRDKLSMYIGFATVAAHNGVRYPLLSEIAMDHLPPGAQPSEKDLERLHVFIETEPTADGLFDSQLSGSTLRAAKRLVEQYERDREQDDTLHAINSDSLLRFLDEQTVRYYAHLSLLGNADHYEPHAFTPKEIEAASAALYEDLTAVRKNKRMFRLPFRRRADDTAVDYTMGKSKNWDSMLRPGEELDETGFAVTIYKTPDQSPPRVYSVNGNDKVKIIDGQGLNADRIVANADLTLIDTNTQHLAIIGDYSASASNGNIGTAEITERATLATRSTKINNMHVQGEVTTTDSQVGSADIAGGASLDGERTDIGKLAAKGGKTVLKDSDIMSLRIDDPDAEIIVSGGICLDYTIHEDAGDSTFTPLPNGFAVGNKEVDRQEGNEIVLVPKRYLELRGGEKTADEPDKEVTVLEGRNVPDVDRGQGDEVVDHRIEGRDLDERDFGGYDDR